MSDASKWKGRRLGPYEMGERYLELPEEEGLLHEAHHVETGEPALVVMPGTGDDWWPAPTSWRMEVTSFTEPKALVLHPKRSAGEKPPTFHELALGFIRMAGTLAPLDEQEKLQAHVLGGSPRVLSRPGTNHWGLVGAGVSLAAGLALLLCSTSLWFRESETGGPSPSHSPTAVRPHHFQLLLMRCQRSHSRNKPDLRVRLTWKWRFGAVVGMNFPELPPVRAVQLSIRGSATCPSRSWSHSPTLPGPD